MTVDWDMIERYLAGHCSAAEQQAIEDWLTGPPVRRSALESLRESVAREPADSPAKDAVRRRLERDLGLDLGGESDHSP